MRSAGVSSIVAEWEQRTSISLKSLFHRCFQFSEIFIFIFIDILIVVGERAVGVSPPVCRSVSHFAANRRANATPLLCFIKKYTRQQFY
jgi:hypothetical protein